MEDNVLRMTLFNSDKGDNGIEFSKIKQKHVTKDGFVAFESKPMYRIKPVVDGEVDKESTSYIKESTGNHVLKFFGKMLGEDYSEFMNSEVYEEIIHEN